MSAFISSSGKNNAGKTAGNAWPAAQMKIKSIRPVLTLWKSIFVPYHVHSVCFFYIYWKKNKQSMPWMDVSTLSCSEDSIKTQIPFPGLQKKIKIDGDRRKMNTNRNKTPTSTHKTTRKRIKAMKTGKVNTNWCKISAKGNKTSRKRHKTLKKKCTQYDQK